MKESTLFYITCWNKEVLFSFLMFGLFVVTGRNAFFDEVAGFVVGVAVVLDVAYHLSGGRMRSSRGFEDLGFCYFEESTL